jgi:hypothetical protein
MTSGLSKDKIKDEESLTSQYSSSAGYARLPLIPSFAPPAAARTINGTAPPTAAPPPLSRELQ